MFPPTSWVLSASLKIKGLFRSLFAKTLLRSKTTDSYTEPITTFWLLHLLLFWRLFPQIIIPCVVPFSSFYSASEALTLHVITTSGLSTFGLWCPCAWEDSSTSGQPGGPLPSLWGLGQWGVCFRGQRPGARMKAAALNTSVPCFRTKWKRKWKGVADRTEWVSRATRVCESLLLADSVVSFRRSGHSALSLI